MLLAFGKSMPHKRNKDADGNSNSPMGGYYGCKAISGVLVNGLHYRVNVMLGKTLLCVS